MLHHRNICFINNGPYTCHALPNLFENLSHGSQTYDTLKVLNDTTLSHHLVPTEVKTQTWALKSHDRSDKKNILKILFNYQNGYKNWNSWWRFPGYPSMYLSLERSILRNTDLEQGFSISALLTLWVG